MKYKTRILGHNITLLKPNGCLACNKTLDLDILERVIDVQNGKMRYTMILKCPSCFKLNFALYNIGEENNLTTIESK